MKDTAVIVKDTCRDCGLNAYCKFSECVCENGYLGSPPNCHPECVTNSDCSQRLACVNEKCVDPCVDNCGRNAECSVIRHVPYCTCPSPLTGNAYNYCFEIKSKCSKNFIKLFCEFNQEKNHLTF